MVRTELPPARRTQLYKVASVSITVSFPRSIFPINAKALATSTSEDMGRVPDDLSWIGYPLKWVRLPGGHRLYTTCTPYVIRTK